MMDDEGVSAKDVITNAEKKFEEFAEILDKIEYVQRETKKLWKEIYQNAFDDRAHAFLLFADLYRVVTNDPNGHALHGKLLTSYLERMNKANDQLLKLAELIENASNSEGQINAEALYDEINSK